MSAESRPTTTRAMLLHGQFTASHWGTYEMQGAQDGRPLLRSYAADPSPSPIGLAMADAYASPLRVRRPAVRAGWLGAEPSDRGGARGREPFVEVDWDEALDIVARELHRVITAHGNASIYGGSYGWASAGRFHHALGQLHRFLNTIGGSTRSVNSYSVGAGEVVMPHVVAPMEVLYATHASWEVLERHTRMFVGFGGVPVKNAQIGLGGASFHGAPGGLARMARAGCRFVNFSPLRGDLDLGGDGCVEWVPIRPGSDTAVMLAMACELILAGRHDEAFLARCCVGFERWRDYLLGRADGVVKDARWAAPICGVGAETIRSLALELSATRSLVNAAWSLQRADHGEQPYWALVGLAAIVGQIGLPGGGFGVAYGSSNLLGSAGPQWPRPTLPQGANPVRDAIPVARVADMLLQPGGEYDYDGRRLRYPDIRLVYWAGGNPFHHHQDLNRLARAWRKPETVIVHEQFWNASARMADIVLPVTSTIERDDIGCAMRDPCMFAMKRICPPPGEARDDYAILSALARRLGCGDVFTEGRDERGWIEAIYARSAEQLASAGVQMPSFAEFWGAGGVRLPDERIPTVMLAAFRADPEANPLATPSGRIELFSERIASFGYDDCPGHPSWIEPTEWLGSARTDRHPLHLISDQPGAKLHSQLDHSAASWATKIDGREPVTINPRDAQARGIVDRAPVLVRNDRGRCVAVAVLSEDVMPGVVKLSTGAWWDPDRLGEPDSICRHGNPNVLTRDAGASRLSQGCAAQSCLVEVERWLGPLPAVRAFEPPALAKRGTRTVDPA